MSEYSGLFDATEGSPNYDSADMGRFFNLLSTNVTPNYENELEVTIGSGLQVVVDSGGMVSKGRFYLQDEAVSGASPLSFSLDPASTGYLRKDRIVIEFSTDTSIAIAKVVKGTDVTSNPTAPALVNTTTVWQESIAIVNISANTLESVDDDRTIQGARVDISVIANKADLTGATFTGDITAPNVSIAATGKMRFSADDYLYLDSSKLMLKINGCIAVQIAMVTVGTSSTPPTGTYPENTQYLEREA